jgi:thioredoxin reductase (NADPH)
MNRSQEPTGMSENQHHPVIILGSGPAGYTAAIYAARANLNPALIQGMEPGGQLMTTTDVDNWPGEPEGIQGPELMDKMKRQAERFETAMVFDHIGSSDLSQRPFTLYGERATYTCDALIISTGASARYLGLPSEEEFKGKGVSACATCDGFFYKNQKVMVVGGGDSAVEEALFLSNIADQVTVVHRRNEFRAEKIMQQKLFDKDNIDVIWNHQLDEVLGDATGVTGARIKDTQGGDTQDLDLQGVFIAIGHKPNTDMFGDELEKDDAGYLITQPDSTATNIPGVFAAGDVQDKVFRQAVTAAGTGCMAALEVDRWLEKNT